MKKSIYCDWAATTYVSGEVLNEMMPAFASVYGNASSLHSYGREAVALVDVARDRVAKALGAKGTEIYFTSGGTESNNWALKGLARANRAKGNHVITSKIEHESVLNTCHELEKEGFEVTYLPVDSRGLVSIVDLIDALRPTTCLVSIMTVNNELGTIQNIKTIANIAHEYGAVFHTDAVQGIGALKISVHDMEIDALSLSAHKFYGPKGVGALYVKEGVKIDSIMQGGNQERAARAGTTNVAGVVGLGRAIEIAMRDMVINQKKIKSLRNYFLSSLIEKIDEIELNGHPYQKVQSIVNLRFARVEAQALLMALDMEGVAVSAGSACTAGSSKPSHVLMAIGLSEEEAKSSIRFSFGKSMSKRDIDYVVEKVVLCVERLRALAPAPKKRGRPKKTA